ncbi:hypothetical protein BASA81_005693 [Batrachochytrium salamandrivorans]|nr:hypothetical protein BASA81_005693 [Batrachochytrium salamandrivorans]
MTICSTSRTDPDKLTSQVYPYIGGNEQQISDFPQELTIEYADVFSKSNANKLPAHSEFDFGIDLEPGFHPPHGKVYSLTPKETQVMATFVQEQLDKNFIRPSTSPAAAPCFFVAKKDGDLRPVQDYRGLNAGTIKKRYPLPLISDLLRDLSKGSVFTTLDLRSAYNLIRIKKGDEWKTAWICKQGLFEQQVMSFGFANALPHFQWVMNSIFSDMLGKFVLVYLDDISIYSPDPTSHVTHVRKYSIDYGKNSCTASSRNASMASISSTILGYISSAGVEMDPKKIDAVQEWPVPTKVHDIQVFLGFTNFYRRFVPNYAKTTQPLTALLKKDIKFDWISYRGFIQALKKAFKDNVILTHADESQEFLVEVDASDFAVAGVVTVQ